MEKPPFHSPAESKKWKGDTFVTWFDGPAHFAARAEWIAGRPELTKASEHARKSCRDSWYGSTFSEAVRRMSEGAPADRVAKVEAIVDEVESADLITSAPGRWANDVYGLLPDVQSALAGVPDSMLRPLLDQSSQLGPIRIAVGIFASAGWSPDQLAKRGAAIAALACLLSRVRPVELIAFYASSRYDDKHRHSNDAYIAAIPLGLSPFNLPVVTQTLADPATMRRLGFTWLHDFGAGHDSIPWPWDLYKNPEEMTRRYRISLGLSNDDLIFEASRLDDDLVRNPVAWVKNQIAQHAGGYAQVDA